MEDFLEDREPLASLLNRLGVNIGDIPSSLASDMARRDMSYEFVWAWCQAAQLFGRSQMLTGILCELLTRDDHEGHEDLTDTLQTLRDAETVEVIYNRAIRPVGYLAYNDSASLARRCVWALHDIGTPTAIQKLEELTQDPRDEVSREALSRIKALQTRKSGAVEPYRRTRDAEVGGL